MEWRFECRTIPCAELGGSSIGLRTRPTHRLGDHLRVARGVERVDDVRRRDACHRLAGAVAVAVVDKADPRACLHQMVLEVVCVAGARRSRGIPLAS
jgi:hypothetical protein